MLHPPTWPDYAAALEHELQALEHDLATSDVGHEEPIGPAGELPDEPIPSHVRERLALLLTRVERASALVAAQMIEVSSRPPATSRVSIPMFIDQRL